MKVFLTLLILFYSGFTLAQVQVQDRLEGQRFYTKNYEVFSPREARLYSEFLAAKKKLKPAMAAAMDESIKQLEPYFTAEYLMALLYWTYLNPNEDHRAVVIESQVLLKAFVLRDVVDHPYLYSAAEKEFAQSQFKNMLGAEFNSDLVFSTVEKVFAKKAKSLAVINGYDSWTQKLKSDYAISFDIRAGLNLKTGHVLSPVGYVKGNQVEVVSNNEVGQERIKWVNDRVMYNGGQLDWGASYMSMPDGKGNGHPVFLDPMFIKIRQMVDSAKDSIFIDIFLFGGTMGATLSKYILDEVIEKKKDNPNFKFLIMHDYATNYGLGKEIVPVFKYIRDRIASEPTLKESVYLLQANINRHPPGIPFGITNFMPKTADSHKLFEKMDTYFESKIDHSKVIVVDGNTDNAQAYFGSKNWTDHSGSYYYDNAIYVKGPGAAVVQGLYYDDVDAALTTDPKERAWFYYKDQNLHNDQYLPIRKEILNWIKVKKSEYAIQGPDQIRFAEANVDGKIKNARNTLVEMISQANSHIYMEQLFIYDKYVNDALIKRKKQIPGLKVKIIADHNGNFGLNGLPNTLFMKQLTEAGIEVRARNTLGVPVNFPNGEFREFHQENHRKITSVDGIVLLGGSSNQNPDTLQGSFREFGAQIFNRDQIQKFETQFNLDWDDSAKVGVFDIDNFTVKLVGKNFSKRLSAIVNDVGATVIRSKDRLEKREN